MNHFVRVWIVLALAICFPNLAFAIGEYYQPANDEEVLAVLPQGFFILSKKVNRNNPGNELSETEVATTVRQYLQLASDNGDERYLGYAKKIIAALPSESIDTIELQLARAALLQREHQFDQALDVLDKITNKLPHHPEAHLMTAYIKMAQGLAQQALPHCAHISRDYGPVLALVCRARANSLMGEVNNSYRQLLALTSPLEQRPTVLREVLLSLGEIASLRGDYPDAEQHFKAALKLNPDDSFVLMCLADTYITSGNYQAGIAMLAGEDNPVLQLRLLIMQSLAGVPAGAQREQQVQRYFEVKRLRNPNLVTRDYGEYLLHIAKRPRKALQVALQNWASQREPADTRLVLHAALASESPDAIENVAEWVKKSGLQDRQINELLRRLELI